MNNQERALSFPTTMGAVLRSVVERETDANGTTYRARMVFEYVVDGVG